MNREFQQEPHPQHHEGRGAGPRGRRFPGGPFGGPDEMFRGGFGHRGGGRRLRRGDVRAAILVLLEEVSLNGYQIIQELSDRSNGAWRPSPGSVYPILQQLEDEKLVVVVASESGRTFELTDAGRTLVAEQRETLGKPWETAAAGVAGAQADLMVTFKQVVMAVRQVGSAGTDAQRVKATAVLADARRAIYRILADDES